MSLTGNIEVFPLQEVLRLLARSNKNGCLRVESGSAHGRIYLDNGALTLATVQTDRDILDQLVAARLVDEQSFDRMDTGEMRLLDHLPEDRSPSDLTDFIREHVVESLHRMRRPGTGSFEFLVDATSRFSTGQSFDAEVAVTEADRRAAEWADIEETIAEMHRNVRMVRELAQSEVSVNSSTWRVLASLEAGASVQQVARTLGMTEFRSAREIAGLMRAGLVELCPTDYEAPRVVATSTWTEPETEVAASREADKADDWDTGSHPWAGPDTEDTSEWKTPSWADEEESIGGGEEDVDDFFSRTEDEVQPEETPSESEDQPAPAAGGWWAEAMETSDQSSEDDADAFLESVFSQLEGPEKGEDDEETGFSMGLLRRRRMGPVSRDITDGD